jgi:hypothetical protein
MGRAAPMAGPGPRWREEPARKALNMASYQYVYVMKDLN